MPKHSILLLFLGFCLHILPICGQDMTNYEQEDVLSLDWQEQILQQVDIDNLGDAAYGELLDELSDLVVWSDTTHTPFSRQRIRQNVIMSSNRCLNTRAGYLNASAERRESGKAYLGDPWHHSVRYRLQVGKQWQAGMNIEKDAGEAWRQQFPLFDSWHAFVSYKAPASFSDHKPLVQSAVIGHYRLRMGCGLLVNQGFSLGKQYFSRQLLEQRSNTFTPFASNAEANYMQGAALDLRLGHRFTLMPYVSALQIDGTLSDKHILTALQTDGMHRTTTEERHRHAAWQIISGARLGLKGEWYDVGIHASYTQLQYDYERNQLYYNKNYFRGHELTQLSADYTVRALGGVLRGELAIDDGGALANITALQYNVSEHWSTSLLYRYYGRHYRQLHASSISESSGMQGEQGVTLTAEGPISRRWTLLLMADWFQFGQPQYGIRNEISQGVEASARLSYSSRRMDTSLAYRLKRKGNYLRQSFDAITTLRPSSSLTLRTQVRGRLYNKEGSDVQPDASSDYSLFSESFLPASTGFSVAQSVAWNCSYWASCPFTVDGQACYFRTDDYDSRIYLTERNVLYGFGLPMLYGEGLRYSLTGALQIGQHVKLELKWAMTNYANRASISSGLQQISGNTQQDLWLQLRLKL